jgi:hypothetical protein
MSLMLDSLPRQAVAHTVFFAFASVAEKESSDFFTFCSSAIVWGLRHQTVLSFNVFKADQGS